MAREQPGFLEYLNLQENHDDLITRTELLTKARQAGHAITDRQLTFYTTQSLLPHALRTGTGPGNYPAIVSDLIEWVLDNRRAGLSVDALRELLPIWKLIAKAHVQGFLHLTDLEDTARASITSLEAAYALPRIVAFLFAQYLPPRGNEVHVTTKDGETLSNYDPAVCINFAVVYPGRPVEHYSPTVIARLALAPVGDPRTDPATIVLGLQPDTFGDEPEGKELT
jgi:hypothetical protein